MSPGLAAFPALLAGAFVAACSLPPPRPGDPLPDLPRKLQARFQAGRVEFERTFTPETGLGPLYNERSCAECHEHPAPGGGGDEIEDHATRFGEGAFSCDPLVDQGGPVVQLQATAALTAALGISREPAPSRASATGRRTSPDLFGLGLLDTVPDKEILAYADPDDSDGDGISGRPSWFFDGRLGRFGRKANTPTLREFLDGAFATEQGITSPAVPSEETIGGAPLPPGVDPVPEPEIDLAALDRTDDFVRLLAPPAAKKLSHAAAKGERIFDRIGCAACHVPTFETGRHQIAALSHRKVAAYTDLLLHDMGPDLSDICLGSAEPSEFRTEPLMGLRFAELFLHDGRARSIEDAVRFHAGEAAGAARRFAELKPADRAALLEFLGSL